MHCTSDLVSTLHSSDGIGVIKGVLIERVHIVNRRLHDRISVILNTMKGYVGLGMHCLIVERIASFRYIALGLHCIIIE